MNGVWINICPDVVTDFHGSDPEEKIGNSGHTIVDIARTIGFEDVDEAVVDRLFQSHVEESSAMKISWSRRKN
jgi:hypothetical protein